MSESKISELVMLQAAAIDTAEDSLVIVDASAGAAGTKRTTIDQIKTAIGFTADYATAAQGALADTAVQPGGNAGTPSAIVLTNATGLPLATGITGTLPVANGGTGLTSVGSALQVLRTNAAGNALEFATVSGGGDLLASNNLSDLASASAARTNLGLGTAAVTASTAYATAAQGSTADSAVQPGDLATVATTGSYSDLGGTPALGTAAAAATGDFEAAGAVSTHAAVTSGVHGISTFGATLVDDADAATARGTLGLGTLATQSGTFSGTSSGTNTGDQDLSGYALTSSLGTAATTDATDYATAAQGSTADSALQPGDIDTLAELNTLLTDATLIDTGDARLSDARTPTSHATSHSSGGGDPITVTNLAGYPGGGTTFLRDDGTFAAPPVGSGDVVGPASAVDSNFAAFDTTTGKLIKDSGSAASTFAAAGHNHSGVYEASGAVSTHAAITSGVHGISAFGATLVDDATAGDARTTLGLGTLATQSGTFSGTSSGTNTGDQDLSGYVLTTAIDSLAELNAIVGVTLIDSTNAALTDARTPLSHTHGNIANGGTVGTTANLPLITGTAGIVQAGAFGTGSAQFCEGNDSRLSDARTPTAHTHTAAQVELAKLGTPAYYTLQQTHDVVHSTGWVSGGAVTDGGSGTVDVAAGVGLIRATDSNLVTLYFCDWDAATGLALTDADTNYIYVGYNAGDPAVAATTTDPTGDNTKILLARVYRTGTELYIFEGVRATIGDHAALMMRAMSETMPFAHVSGAATSEVGTRQIQISSGVFWHGLTRIETSAIDTTGVGTFDAYYRDGVGGWTEVTGQTAINNTQYDDGSGTLATLTANRYGVHWVYLSSASELAVVFGQDDYQIGAAQDAMVPTPPEPLLVDSRMIAKIIVQKSAATFTSIENAFMTMFQGSPISGGGDVLGSASSTDNAIVRFDGAGGKTIQNSGITIADGASGTLSGTNTGDQDLSGLAVKANNLSDLASASTARTNLGLGSAATTDSGDYATAAHTHPGVYEPADATILKDADIGTTVQAYDADLTTWAGVTPGTGVATALAVAVGSAGAPVVFDGAGGTPSSITLTNATGTAASLTAGLATAANGIKSATTTVSVSGATAPSSGQVLTATSSTAATWQTPAGGGDALVANPLSQFAATTSAQLRGVLSDELGTGAALFDGATPTSLTLTNATGLPLATGVTGTLPVANGGTGSSSGLGLLGKSYALYEERQTTGTDGGTFTSGADRTRALNTEVRDPDGIGSLSSSQVTLSAGTYFCHFGAFGTACAEHQTWLYDVTGSATLIAGSCAYGKAANFGGTESAGRDFFTLSVTSAIELRHRCIATRAADGLGRAGSFSSPGHEKYAHLAIWKIA